MKKIISFLLCLFLLCGCTAKDYDYEGSYALLTKGECTYFVVKWEYPNDNMNFVKDDYDLDNLSQYIDENASMSGEGININKLLGNLGFNRKFLRVMPIGIHSEDVDKIIKKNIKVFLNLECSDGNTYKVRLKYDKSIKE